MPKAKNAVSKMPSKAKKAAKSKSKSPSKKSTSPKKSNKAARPKSPKKSKATKKVDGERKYGIMMPPNYTVGFGFCDDQ